MQRRLLSVRSVRGQCLGAATSLYIFSTTAFKVSDVSPGVYQNMIGSTSKVCPATFNATLSSTSDFATHLRKVGRVFFVKSGLNRVTSQQDFYFSNQQNILCKG